jgi:putative heme-binding domain-containing protein
LFKISYTGIAAPLPVLAYAASPIETRVIFDRALDTNQIHDLVTQCAVSMGKFVTAGERFESFRPGYQAVKNQLTMPRFELPVAAARVVDDQRTVILQTPLRTESVNYAVTLPGGLVGSRGEIDLLADLTGVEALWASSSSTQSWSGWLPHLDLTASRGLTTGSARHAEFFKRLSEDGWLELRGQLDLWQMLHPAVQPESKLDFEYPPETVTVVLKASSNLELRVGTNTVQTGQREARITSHPNENRWLPIEVTFATGANAATLDVSWFTAEDPRPRPFPCRRILLPWAKPYVAVATVVRTPEIEGGDWERGKKIFFGEQATCSKCHEIRGEGGKIGADLSNLIYRDYASVMKDITEPSAAINPEHIAYNVELKDGSIENGVLVKNNKDEVVLGQASGKNLTIPKANVAGMKASAVSLMPEGLLKALDAQQQKDLMTFLLTPGPKVNKK